MHVWITPFFSALFLTVYRLNTTFHFFNFSTYPWQLAICHNVKVHQLLSVFNCRLSFCLDFLKVFIQYHFMDKFPFFFLGNLCYIFLLVYIYSVILVTVVELYCHVSIKLDLFIAIITFKATLPNVWLWVFLSAAISSG